MIEGGYVCARFGEEMSSFEGDSVPNGSAHRSASPSASIHHPRVSGNESTKRRRSRSPIYSKGSDNTAPISSNQGGAVASGELHSKIIASCLRRVAHSTNNVPLSKLVKFRKKTIQKTEQQDLNRSGTIIGSPSYHLLQYPSY